jgi:hypothetical protein
MDRARHCEWCLRRLQWRLCQAVRFSPISPSHAPRNSHAAVPGIRCQVPIIRVLSTEDLPYVVSGEVVIIRSHSACASSCQKCYFPPFLRIDVTDLTRNGRTTTTLTTSFAQSIAGLLGLGDGEKIVEVIIRGVSSIPPLLIILRSVPSTPGSFAMIVLSVP